MHRISANNPVRRRLFSDDNTDEARIDNFANVLQESITTERLQKKQKWNFDFENDTPLEGDIIWYPCDDGRKDWVGVQTEVKNEITEVDDDKEANSFLAIKCENETTPKSNKDEESVPLIRKRRNDVNNPNDSGVKRKISFD